MTFKAPTFVDRSANPLFPSGNTRKQTDPLAIANYYTSLHPDNTLDPSSILYKLAIQEYNRKVNSSQRPPVPQWYCGFVNPKTGELSLNLTDAQLRASAGLVTEPIPDQLDPALPPSGEYLADQCLLLGPPGSHAYAQCDAVIGSDIDEETTTDEIDWAGSMSSAEGAANAAEAEADAEAVALADSLIPTPPTDQDITIGGTTIDIPNEIEPAVEVIKDIFSF